MACEEQLLIKYYMIKHLILLKIQNMMDIKEVFLQWFINVLTRRQILKSEILATRVTRDKSASGGAIKNENMLSKELAKELRKPIIRKFETKSTLVFYKQYLGC